MKIGSSDDLLDQLRQEGRVESQGRFSLSPEKLREKLAAFQFERSSQWALKVIQALVVAQVESCDILQSHVRTEFLIKSSSTLFEVSELEVAFLDPEAESASGRALSHLVTALWFLSFNLKLAWLWKGRDSEFGLMWTGTDLQKIAMAKTELSKLEVGRLESRSQKSLLSQLFSKLGQGIGASGCAEVTRELSLYAYTCPFPLRLDGRRIDSLLGCSSVSQPRKLPSLSIDLTSRHEKIEVAALGSGTAEGPVLCLPPGTFAGRTQSEFVARADSTVPSTGATWIALLVVHLQEVNNRKMVSWEPYPLPSRVSWVRYGVVVAESHLAMIAGVSCHLFVSADDRTVDISGLKMIDSALSLEPAVRSGMSEWLTEQTINFFPRHRSAQRYSMLVAGSIAVGACVVAFASGSLLYGVETLGMAGLAKVIASSNDDSQILEAKFGAELEKLRQEWGAD